MALATYKDLCIDAVDPARLGAFWATALGLEPDPLDDGDVVLRGPTPQHAVWVNRVPEPVTVKQRVHLDVHADAVDDVLALGATPEDLDHLPLEGGPGPRGWRAVRVRARDRARLPAVRDRGRRRRPRADRRPGGRTCSAARSAPTPRMASRWVEQIPGAPFEGIVFAPVPEPKTVKNRIHWDVDTDSVDACSSPRVPRVLRERDDEIGWTVLADPEGNEFCAFTD